MFYLIIGTLFGLIFGVVDMFFMSKRKQVNTSSDLLWAFINKASIGFWIGMCKFLTCN